MSNKPIEKTDYRYGIGDKYGRAVCDDCGKLRKINVYWQHTDTKMCTECSHKPGVAFASSVTGGKIVVRL